MGKPPFGGKPSGGKPPFGQKKGNPFQKKGNPFQKPGGFGGDPFGPPKPDKSLDQDAIKKDQKEIEDVKKMRAAADAEVRKAMVGKYNDGEDTVDFYPAMLSFGTFTKDGEKSDKSSDKDEKSDDKPEKAAKKDEKSEKKSEKDDKDDKKKPAKKEKNTLKEAAEAYPVIGSIDSLLNFTRKRGLALAWTQEYRSGAGTWLPVGTVVRLLADGSVVGLHKDGKWSTVAVVQTR